MKTLILVLTLTTFGIINKSFGTENESKITCSYSDMTQRQKDLSLVFSLSSQVPEVKKRLIEILNDMGYPQYKEKGMFTPLIYCKDDPSKVDNFELIREVILTRITSL